MNPAEPATAATQRSATTKQCSIVIPARAAYLLARLGRALLFGVKATFFAAPDAAVRPKSFEDHFSGSGGVRFVFAIGDAEAADVVEQSLHLGELLVALGGGDEFGKFQFTAGFKPLHGRLEADFC